MVLNNNKTILYYHLENSEIEIIKSKTIEDKKIKLKEIDSKMSNMTINDILGESPFYTVDNTLLKEKVILFYNLSDEELNSMIKSIRVSFKERPIMAVVTDTSKKWSFKYLLEHLVEEREWYKSQGK